MGYPFSILGLSSNATKNEVRKAYHELARKYHPDKGVSAAGERMKQINAAYKDALDALENPSSSATSGHGSHRSHATSSRHAPSSSASEFRFEPATPSSASTHKGSTSYASGRETPRSYGGSSRHGDQASERTVRYADGYGSGSSSRPSSSRHGTSGSRADRSSYYGGTDRRSRAESALSSVAEDVEAELGVQTRRLERLQLSKAANGEKCDSCKVKELEQSLEECKARLGELEDKLQRGKSSARSGGSRIVYRYAYA